MGNGFIGEVAEQILRRFTSTAKLCYKNHTCYVTDVNKVFKWLRCSTCDKFFRTIFSLQRHSLNCDELVRNIHPRSVYQLRETFLDKLKAFDMELTKDKLLFNNFAVFDFESICLKSSTTAATKTITWVGKHEPISVYMTSNLLEEPSFICDTETRSLVSSFVTSLENLAEEINLETGLMFLNIGTTNKEKFEPVTSTSNKKNQRFHLLLILIKILQLTLKTKRMKKETLLYSFYQLERTNYLSSNSFLSVVLTLFQFLVSTVLSII